MSRVIYNGIDFSAQIDAVLAQRRAEPAEEQLGLELKVSRRKLSLDLARHIRRLRGAYDFSQRELAAQFGVSPTAIRYVLQNRIYAEAGE